MKGDMTITVKTEHEERYTDVEIAKAMATGLAVLLDDRIDKLAVQLEFRTKHEQEMRAFANRRTWDADDESIKALVRAIDERQEVDDLLTHLVSRSESPAGRLAVGVIAR